MLLGASGVVSLRLLIVNLLNMLEISGCHIGNYTSLVILIIMFGNLVITVLAKNKYLQYSIEKRKTSKWQ